VVNAAKAVVERELGSAKAQLQQIVRAELIRGGVLDETGKAILVKGDRGERGEKGEQGERGSQGPQGQRGERGERGEQGGRGERGAQGAQGLPGEKGLQGERVRIRIGDVTSSLKRSEVGVTDVSGNPNESVLNFVLPNVPGARGPQGPIDACLEACERLINERFEQLEAKLLGGKS
jgi:hypothetical protein